MSYERLPFKNYTVMSNRLIQLLGCSDVFRAYVLLLTTDKNTLKTDTTIDQLALFVEEATCNYKNGKTSKSFNVKLRETGEVFIDKKEPIRADRRRNLYIFKPVQQGNYRRISRAFYDHLKELNLKLKGFILKLFSVTDPHSYLINISIDRLSSIIHMTPRTVKAYIKQLKDLDMLEDTKDGLLLKTEGLLIDDPRDIFVKNTILRYDNQIALRRQKGMPLTKRQLIYVKVKDGNFEHVEDKFCFLSALEKGRIALPKPKTEPGDEKLPVLIL